MTDTTVIQAIAKSKNMITAALNCVFEVLNNPSGPQRANEQGVCAQNPVFNSSTSLYLKKSMPSGMKNSLQREYTALVLWQEGKEEISNTHTHTRSLWAGEVCSKKSQAVKLCLLCSFYLEDYFL